MGKRHPRLRTARPAGSVLVVALVCMLVLSILGTVFLGISVTEHNIAYNAVYSEGAFTAAEAAVQTGVAQLSANTTTSAQAIPVTAFATDYNYRSGRRTDATPQPLEFSGKRVEPGYNLARGTGYNPAGYTFHSYRIPVTGAGPRSAQRELEAMAEFGPVPE
jgi:beta-glucanase (GH16 family)